MFWSARLLAVCSLFALLAASCGVIENLRDINTPPPERGGQFPKLEGETVVYVPLTVDLNGIARALNTALPGEVREAKREDVPVKFPDLKTENPLYDPVEWIKTKNPKYDPGKWIKTKNPAYQPQKWIKGPFGSKTKNPTYNPKKWIKTKNPKYDPVEWIKTKNPKYDPSKWIITGVPDGKVGVQYDFKVKRGEITLLSTPSNNGLYDPTRGGFRLSVPIEVDGTVGLRGDLANTISLDKKRVKVKGNVSLTLHPGFGEDWCPQFDAKVDIDWSSFLAIELVGTPQIIFPIPPQLLVGQEDIDKITQALMSEINSKSSCEFITSRAREAWRLYSKKLSSDPALYLHVRPREAMLSNLFVVSGSSNEVKLAAAVVAGTSIDEQPLGDDDKDPKLPVLQKAFIDEAGFFDVKMPVNLSYASINDRLEREFVGKEYEITEEAPPKLFRATNGGHVEVTSMRVYPSGYERLAIAVGFKTHFGRRAANVKGTFYLSGEPRFDDYVFSIAEVEPAAEVDNPLYPIALAFFKERVSDEIESATTTDLSVEVDDLHEVVRETVVVTQVGEAKISIEGLEAGLIDFVTAKDRIVAVIEIAGDISLSLK